MTFETPPLSTLQRTLSDPAAPIGMRMRATYFLRQIYDDAQRNESPALPSSSSDEAATAIETLCANLQNPAHGALLRHEFAYVLGQLRDVRALPALEKTLLSEQDDIMIRHECAEALGAIGSATSVPVLQRCARDTSVEVGQTCRLALYFIQWKDGGGEEGDVDAPAVCACMLSPYSSHDPAPPHPAHVNLSAIQIGEILRDVDAPLFQRFRAMFSLRNRGGEDAVHQLGKALISDTSSALLRHEVAYVLGQMQHPSSVEYLSTSLKRTGEHKMVRHESAEALGAIEERWGECEEILRQFLEDDDVVVRESCMVALDAADYFGYVKEEGGDEVVDDRTRGVAMNFSLHKAETNGRVVGQDNCGVLHNHFNIVA
ncbi:hypothetical protein HJC23_012593 [Cyclotella cryptica]|uniref:Deoxyhypusine hydroxylase n=1 Tax=Cyclotella cryptica TaxID=29204 RepID=A0ABD3NWS7_9STRA